MEHNREVWCHHGDVRCIHGPREHSGAMRIHALERSFQTFWEDSSEGGKSGSRESNTGAAVKSERDGPGPGAAALLGPCSGPWLWPSSALIVTLRWLPSPVHSDCCVFFPPHCV